MSSLSCPISPQHVFKHCPESTLERVLVHWHFSSATFLPSPPLQLASYRSDATSLYATTSRSVQCYPSPASVPSVPSRSSAALYRRLRTEIHTTASDALGGHLVQVSERVGYIGDRAHSDGRWTRSGHGRLLLSSFMMQICHSLPHTCLY